MCVCVLPSSQYRVGNNSIGTIKLFKRSPIKLGVIDSYQYSLQGGNNL